MSRQRQLLNHSNGPTGIPIYDRVLELYAQGKTQTEIGKDLGYSQQWISEILRQANEWMVGDYLFRTQGAELVDQSPGPEARLEQAELRKMLAEFLESLDDADRQIAVFLALDKTQSDIANHLRMSQQRVSQRVARIREKLTEALGRFSQDPL